jgi:hypothetical protein
MVITTIEANNAFKKYISTVIASVDMLNAQKVNADAAIQPMASKNHDVKNLFNCFILGVLQIYKSLLRASSLIEAKYFDGIKF